MNAYFIWNDESSTDYGVYLQDIPPRIIPQERFTNVTIPGRPGSLTMVEGEDVYDDILYPCECFIQNEDNIDDICTWLRGKGTLTFGNREEGHYEARIANQISFDQVVRGNPYRRFTVTFRCSPFFYLDGVKDIIVTSSGTFVNNQGNVYSEPKITVYGSGNIDMMIGTTPVLLENVNEYIVLDCALKEAYKEQTLLNSAMTGNFPIFYPGDNAISWMGSNVTRIEIEPRWREI